MRQFVISLAKRAGNIQRKSFGKAIELEKMAGDWHDFLTTTDHASEELIIGGITKRYPSHTVLAEESGLHLGVLDKKWYIDPLDGTGNFLNGIPFFASSISFWENGRASISVIYDPIHDACFFADQTGAYLNDSRLPSLISKPLEKMIVLTEISPNPTQREQVDRLLASVSRLFWKVQLIRNTGCTALDLAYVAAGRVHACILSGLSRPWDIAAGGHIVEAAGGAVTTWDGQRWNPGSHGILASSVNGQKMLLEILRNI